MEIEETIEGAPVVWHEHKISIDAFRKFAESKLGITLPEVFFIGDESIEELPYGLDVWWVENLPEDD